MTTRDTPHSATARTRLAVCLATGFGLGLSPVASGTAGAILGLGIVAAVWHAGILWQILTSVLLSLAAIPICHAAETHFGQKDDRRIVADEYLTFPICMIGLPAVGWVLAIAFLSNRFFDVVKFPPSRSLQRLHGGLGIVIDDVFSCLYSLAANHAAYWVLSRLLDRL